MKWWLMNKNFTLVHNCMNSAHLPIFYAILGKFVPFTINVNVRDWAS